MNVNLNGYSQKNGKESNMNKGTMSRYKDPEKKREYAREYSKKRFKSGEKKKENKEWQVENRKYWRDTMRKRKDIKDVKERLSEGGENG